MSIIANIVNKGLEQPIPEKLPLENPCGWSLDFWSPGNWRDVRKNRH